MISVPEAGHFQFLDKQTGMQRAVCTQGRVPDYSVRQISQVQQICNFTLSLDKHAHVQTIRSSSIVQVFASSVADLLRRQSWLHGHS